MKTAISVALAGIVAVPGIALAQYYYSYPQYTPSINYSAHTFAPTTYVNTSPYVQVNAPQYTYQSSYAYSYPSSAYSYSYPSYSYSYPSYNYSYPSYSYSTYSYPTYYDYTPSYSYSSTNQYWWNDSYEYCYSGYGCYPMPVDDPHQWIYDPWTGNWY